MSPGLFLNTTDFPQKNCVFFILHTQIVKIAAEAGAP